MHIKRPGHSFPPPKGVELQELKSLLSKDGKVRALPDVKPLIPRHGLGHQLEMKGLKLFKMMIIHPKSTFDLLTGRLTKMRQTHPDKYLAELADLCTSKQACKMLITEGNNLKKDAPRLADQITGHQRTLLAKLAEHINQSKTQTEFSNAVLEFGALTQGISIPPQLTDKTTPFGKALRAMTRNTHKYSRGASDHQLQNMLYGLAALAKAIPEPQPNYLTGQLDTLQKTLDARKTIPKTEPATYEKSQSALPTIEELPELEEEEERQLLLEQELEELWETLKQEPNNEQIWTKYDELEENLSAKQKIEFLDEAYDQPLTSEEAKSRLIGVLNQLLNVLEESEQEFAQKIANRLQELYGF